MLYLLKQVNGIFECLAKHLIDRVVFNSLLLFLIEAAIFHYRLHVGVNTLFVVLLHTFLEFLQCAHAPSLHLFHFVEHIVEVLARAGRLTSLCHYCLVIFV